MEDMDFVKIGEKMKEMRNQHGITQEQVARDLGCTIGFISNVENSRTKLNLKVLSYYARMCGVTIDTFLNVGDDSVSQAEKEEAILIDELLRIFHTFDVENQKKIIKTLKIWKQ